MRFRPYSTCVRIGFLLLSFTILGLLWYVHQLSDLLLKTRQIESRVKEQLLGQLHDELLDVMHGPDDATHLKYRLSSLQKSVRQSLHPFSSSSSLDAPALTCGLGVPASDKLVCDEYHVYNPNAFYWDRSCWHLNQTDCPASARKPSWKELLTVVVFFRQFLSAEELEERLFGSERYSGFNVVVAFLKGAGVGQGAEFKVDVKGGRVTLVEVEDERDYVWKRLLKHVETPFVLFGRDLFRLTDWAELERSVRLLQDDHVAVVGGATRNMTGHFSTSCYQAGLENYQLYLKPGYEKSSCDCMHCPVIRQGPFVTRKALLDRIPLNHESGSADAMFLSWFLDLQSAGYQTLLCPDIYYDTYRSQVTALPDRQWQELAKKHQFQGLVLDHSPKVARSFSCESVGLSCQPRQQSSRAVLLPWCCLSAYAHILRHLERLSVDLGFHYELDSGSALGALKLGQYLPWDIDGDIYFRTEDRKLFWPPEGEAMKRLEREGIQVYRHQDDNYSDKGAGYFMLYYKGIEVEMLGQRGQLSLDDDNTNGVPTRILVGDTWTRIHANPGRFARSRYGDGYLRHAQSWRYLGAVDSNVKYKVGSWRLCTQDVNYHGCLEKYPADGNVMFRPENFREWRVDD